MESLFVAGALEKHGLSRDPRDILWLGSTESKFLHEASSLFFSLTNVIPIQFTKKDCTRETAIQFCPLQGLVYALHSRSYVFLKIWLEAHQLLRQLKLKPLRNEI
jgi:hypothetical protein